MVLLLHCTSLRAVIFWRLSLDECSEIAFSGISNFCELTLPYVTDATSVGWYWSIRSRRPTDERIIPIRFGYCGRLAGTYEKISFAACVTTNWYETTPLPCALRAIAYRYAGILSYSYSVIERWQIVSPHSCLTHCLTHCFRGTSYISTFYFFFN